MQIFSVKFLNGLRSGALTAPLTAPLTVPLPAPLTVYPSAVGHNEESAQSDYNLAIFYRLKFISKGIIVVDYMSHPRRHIFIIVRQRCFRWSRASSRCWIVTNNLQLTVTHCNRPAWLIAFKISLIASMSFYVIYGKLYELKFYSTLGKPERVDRRTSIEFYTYRRPKINGGRMPGPVYRIIRHVRAV